MKSSIDKTVIVFFKVMFIFKATSIFFYTEKKSVLSCKPLINPSESPSWWDLTVEVLDCGTGYEVL